jgi:hypothetical protein
MPADDGEAYALGLLLSFIAIWLFGRVADRFEKWFDGRK